MSREKREPLPVERLWREGGTVLLSVPRECEEQNALLRENFTEETQCSEGARDANS
jgi:hypothetical protein